MCASLRSTWLRLGLSGAAAEEQPGRCGGVWTVVAVASSCVQCEWGAALSAAALLQVDDGVNCYKALTKDSRAVAAGGGVEIALARRLRDHGSRQPGLQQYSICAYADALEAIPRTLAENSGLDAEVRLVAHTRPHACVHRCMHVL